MHKCGYPGIGKTYIIFLLAHMLKMQKQDHTIYLVTINEVLQKQLRK